MKKRRSAGLFLLGAVFVGIAFLMIGNLAGWWLFNDYSGWWTLFIIVPGLSSMLSGFTFGGLLITLFGVFLLASARGWLSGVPGEIYWIAALALFGLWLIYRALFKRRKEYPSAPFVPQQGVPDDYVNAAAVFMSTGSVNCSSDFRGGTATSVFGDAKLDISGAAVRDGAELKAVAVFGQTEIISPRACRLIITGVPVFGQIDDRTISQDNQSLPVLKINCVSVFGGIKII